MFRNVIVRRPSRSMIEGITTADLGLPDYDLALRQHDQYIRAMEACGAKVTVLPAMEEYPDSCFVEDVAVVTPKCAIITNPGAPSRNGEKAYIVEALRAFYPEENIEYITEGTIEGGDVLVGGRSISKLKDYQRYATMGRVYQDPAAGTCPNLTMLENLSLADNKGGSYGLGRGVNKKRIDFYRDQLSSLGLGLEDKLDVRMGSLSGGQRQAVALLMATMTPLKFLILDEHTAALDPKTAEVIMALTDRVIREKHLTAMMVTHNLRYAVEYGDRILMMNRGRVVLDRAGAEKRATSMDDILTMFNQISLETGN